jgi:hypothetical protein
MQMSPEPRSEAARLSVGYLVAFIAVLFFHLPTDLSVVAWDAFWAVILGAGVYLMRSAKKRDPEVYSRINPFHF